MEINNYKFEAEDYFLLGGIVLCSFAALGLIAYGVTLFF